MKLIAAQHHSVEMAHATLVRALVPARLTVELLQQRFVAMVSTMIVMEIQIALILSVVRLQSAKVRLALH